MRVGVAWPVIEGSGEGAPRRHSGFITLFILLRETERYCTQRGIVQELREWGSNIPIEPSHTHRYGHETPSLCAEQPTKKWLLKIKLID